MVAVPGAQEGDAVLVTDPLAQRLQHHAPSLVDGAVGQGCRAAWVVAAMRVQNEVCWAGVLAYHLSCCAADGPPCRSVQIHSNQVANPSCSQISGQVRSVTASPNVQMLRMQALVDLAECCRGPQEKAHHPRRV